MDNGVCDCLIIGGGASGLFAAARLIKESAGKLDVIIIEAGPKIARKLLLTGSGRCNLTNSNCDISRYNTDDKDKLGKILGKFTTADTVSFFENDLGVLVTLKEELYYPATFKSVTVTDSLRLFLEEGRVKFLLDSKVTGLTSSGSCYTAMLESGTSISARNVILATGGASYPGTGSDGAGVALVRSFVGEEGIEPFKPALVPLRSEKRSLKSLAGIRCSCKIKVVSGGEDADASAGEVLFTKDGGVSGICIMDVSGTALRLLDAGRKVSVILDLMQRQPVEVCSMFLDRKLRFPSRKCSDAFSGMINKNILEAVMRDLMIDPDMPAGDIKDARLAILSKALCGWEIPVSGSEGFDNAQVSSGGVKLSCLNDSLNVKDHPGLYVIGEACNVNGICGGYNLQWAWSSAAAAARDIAYV